MALNESHSIYFFKLDFMFCHIYCLRTKGRYVLAQYYWKKTVNFNVNNKHSIILIFIDTKFVEIIVYLKFYITINLIAR